MEKYGVLHEMECSCGCKIITNEREQTVETIKEASKGLFGVEHAHKFKEVSDAGTQGSDVRPEQSNGKSSV